MTCDVSIVELLPTSEAKGEDRRAVVRILIGDFDENVFAYARRFGSPRGCVLLLALFQQLEDRGIRLSVDGRLIFERRVHAFGIVSSQGSCSLVPHHERIVGAGLLDIVNGILPQQRPIGTLHKERHARVGFQIRGVVPLVVQDDRDHAQVESRIGSRDHGNPSRALLGGRAEVGIERDDLGSRLLCLEEVARGYHARLQHIASHVQDGLGVLPIGHLVRRGSLLTRFGERWREAIAQPDIDSAVGFFLALEQLGEERGERVNGRLDGNGLRPVFLLGLFNLLGNGVKRLVPGDLDELARTTLAHALERNLQALFAVRMLNLGNALQADGFVAFVGPFVRFDQNHAPIANRALQMAVALAVAIVERIPHPLLRLGMRLRRCEPAVGRGHAGSSRKAQRACRSARCLEKTPSREPALRASGS